MCCKPYCFVIITLILRNNYSSSAATTAKIKGVSIRMNLIPPLTMAMNSPKTSAAEA